MRCLSICHPDASRFATRTSSDPNLGEMSLTQHGEMGPGMSLEERMRGVR